MCYATTVSPRLTVLCLTLAFFFFFFNDTATTEIYTLSLHDALPISERRCRTSFCQSGMSRLVSRSPGSAAMDDGQTIRSEEHTSELQSRLHLVCRLLLEKKKTTININDVELLMHNCLDSTTTHTHDS